MRREEVRTFFLFITPWLLGLFGLIIFPFVWGGAMSLTNYTGLNIRNLRFMGLANYRRAFTDDATWHGLARTGYITLIGVPIQVVGGFMLAMLLKQGLKAQGVFRTLFYLPYIVPVSALTLIWFQILARNAGLLNLIIEVITGQQTTINWLLDHSNESLVMLYAWGLGGGMIIYLAGLQNVPSEFTEAATVDGANAFQKFFRITLPLMTPVLLFQTVTGLIWTLQLLVPALLLTPGGVGMGGLRAGLTIPPNNRLYMVHLYEQTFIYQRFAYGLALAWILFVLIMTLSLILVRTSRHWVYYEVDIDAKKTEA
jgi:multiple sugar transport system permease protein